MTDTGTMFYDEPEDPRLEFEVIVKFRYKTDPGNYELSGPPENMLQEIAEFDKETFENEPDALFEEMQMDGMTTITVTPVAKENNG